MKVGPRVIQFIDVKLFASPRAAMAKLVSVTGYLAWNQTGARVLPRFESAEAVSPEDDIAASIG